MIIFKARAISIIILITLTFLNLSIGDTDLAFWPMKQTINLA